MRGLTRGIAAVAVGMLLGAPALRAQGAEFSLGGGVGVPLGDFDDAAKLGWHGLAAVSFVPTGWPVGIQIDGSYQQFNLDHGANPGFAGLKNRFIMGTGDIVFKFKSSEESSFRPYLIGGAGVYNSKVTGSDNANNLIQGGTTDFGLNAGAGFDIKTSGIGLFLEGRFHDVFNDGPNTKFIPITLGIRLGGH
jgi:Outer membrane protein beta-barrel domain